MAVKRGEMNWNTLEYTLKFFSSLLQMKITIVFILTYKQINNRTKEKNKIIDFILLIFEFEQGLLSPFTF